MAAVPNAVRPRVARVDIWLLAGWITAVAVTLAGTVHDTDPYWQIRAGEENLDGMPLARPDSWSWAPVEGLFYPNSPAWNVGLALAWRSLGTWGLYAVTVLSIAACLALVAWLALRLGAHAVVTVVVVLVTSAGVLPILSPRPALPAQALLLLAVALGAWWTDRASRHSWPVNGAVAGATGLALSVVGNWVHLSWSTLAIAAAAAWAVLALLAPGLRPAVRAALVVGGTVGLVGGILAGPYGMDVWERSAVVLQACRDLIVEWSSPFSPEFGLRWWPEALVVLAVIAMSALWCLRTVRRSRLSDPRLALASALTVVALPYAVAGLALIRFIPVALVMVAPVAAAGLTAVLRRWRARVVPVPTGAGYVRRRLPEWLGARFWRVVLWLVLAMLAPLALFAGSRHAEPATSGVDAQLPPGCRMFGTSIEAASIILTRPDVQIWYDGRADYWGRDRLVEAHAYLYQVDQPTLVPPGTTCVVLMDDATDAGLSTLTAALDADPQWQRVPGTTGANLWLPAH